MTARRPAAALRGGALCLLLAACSIDDIDLSLKKCGSSADCPAGFRCGADAHCAKPSAPDGGAGGAVNDVDVSAAGAPCSNLLPNAGFELGSDCSPWSPSETTVQRDMSSPRSGNFACKVCPNASPTVYRIGLSIDSGFKAGDSMRLEAWVRAAEPSGVGRSSQLAVDITNTSRSVLLGTTYERLSYDYLIPSDAAATHDLWILANAQHASDCFLVDDVSLCNLTNSGP